MIPAHSPEAADRRQRAAGRIDQLLVKFVGRSPRYFTISGANTATRMRKIRNAPAARATLSLQPHPGDLPERAALGGPGARHQASEAAVSAPVPTSGGTVNFRLLPRSNVARKITKRAYSASVVTAAICRLGALEKPMTPA